MQTVSHNDYKFTYPDNTIKFESIANPLNIQETSGVTNFEINKSQLSFELTLAADASKPTLYLGNDAQNEIQCVLDSPKLTCTLDSISDVTDSKIYYKGGCDSLIESQLTITKVKDSIIVSQITLVNTQSDATCVKTVFTSVKVTVESNPGEVTSIVLTAGVKDYTFSPCTSTATTILCNAPEDIIEETYKYKVINSDTYDFSVSDTITNTPLIYKADFIGDNSKLLTQQVNKDVEAFTIVLTKSTDIFFGNDENNKLTCTSGDEGYSCGMDIADYDSDISSKIYYKDSCGVLVDSGITVSLVHPIDITVDGVYLGDNTKCIIKAINPVTITVDKTPLSTVHYAILTDSAENPTEYDLEECSFTEKKITCALASGTEEITTPGIYKLKDISSVDAI